MNNEYGAKIGKNGYAESILQTDLSHCYLCGRSNCKLDRHEVFGNAHRSKSKRYGLWLMLCHDSCHLGALGAHMNADTALRLKQGAQRKAMQHYGWTVDDFRKEFGKSYV